MLNVDNRTGGQEHHIAHTLCTRGRSLQRGTSTAAGLHRSMSTAMRLCNVVRVPKWVSATWYECCDGCRDSVENTPNTDRVPAALPAAGIQLNLVSVLHHPVEFTTSSTGSPFDKRRKHNHATWYEYRKGSLQRGTSAATGTVTVFKAQEARTECLRLPAGGLQPRLVSVLHQPLKFTTPFNWLTTRQKGPKHNQTTNNKLSLTQ